MSVFKYGFNKVNRRVVIPAIKAAQVFDIPAGAHLQRIYAQNRSTTATSLSVGNAVGGAQYLAAIAVPVADGTGPGILAPQNALAVAISKVVSNVNITLTAYTLDADGKGTTDVVVEYEELLDSLPIASQGFPRAY
jgi:hypothetical protein